MNGAAKQHARRWQDALRRSDPKDWDAVSDRMLRRFGRAGGRALQGISQAMEQLQGEQPALPVTIVSARELDSRLEKSILKELFGDRDVAVTKKTDPSLIAGVVVRTEDAQWDLSVKNQLERLKRSIVEA